MKQRPSLVCLRDLKFTTQLIISKMRPTVETLSSPTWLMTRSWVRQTPTVRQELIWLVAWMIPIKGLAMTTSIRLTLMPSLKKLRKLMVWVRMKSLKMVTKSTQRWMPTHKLTCSKPTKILISSLHQKVMVVQLSPLVWHLIHQLERSVV